MYTTVHIWYTLKKTNFTFCCENYLKNNTVFSKNIIESAEPESKNKIMNVKICHTS